MAGTSDLANRMHLRVRRLDVLVYPLAVESCLVLWFLFRLWLLLAVFCVVWFILDTKATEVTMRLFPTPSHGYSTQVHPRCPLAFLLRLLLEGQYL